jgi:hypothetical protein
MQNMGQAATGQNYFPEWIASTYILNDENQRVRSTGLPPEQRANMFGISTLPMQRNYADRPSTWADPATPYAGDTVQQGKDVAYRDLLLIASGLQMAGPNLTPATFEAGLQRAAFPNPDLPIMAGHVGFLGGSHAMTTTYTEIWWSNTAQSMYADEGAGTWCYVDHGARHSLGDALPPGDPFFQGTCDSGLTPVS